MNKKAVIFIAGAVGGLTALVVCVAFYFFFPNSRQTVEIKNAPPESSRTPLTQATIPPPKEVPVTDITSVALYTVYTGYFPEQSKCRNSYNEQFGDADGISSASSPCTLDLSFGRDGKATKTISLQRYNKNAGKKETIQKTVSTGTVTSDQFNELAQTIGDSNVFKSWNDMTALNVVNSKISVVFSGGTRTPMSNVSETTTDFLALMDAFKKLEIAVVWQDAE